MLALLFFSSHRLLDTAASEIRILFSCLSWVYSLLILWLLASWAAREPGYWISMQLFCSLSLDGELQVLRHDPGFGSFVLAWTTFPDSSGVSDPEIPAWWLELQTPLTKPSLWRTELRELQSGFQRAGLGLATLLSTAGHGNSYSAPAATHTGEWMWAWWIFVWLSTVVLMLLCKKIVLWHKCCQEIICFQFYVS